MAGRETADIVFCVDVSGSMRPAIDGVRKNIEKLVKSLNQTGGQMVWDVRFDYLAYSVTDMGNMRLETMNCRGPEVINEVYNGASANQQTSNKLFTRDIAQFCDALNNVHIQGDEATLPAIDIAADFPFRDAATCHRVIVLLTDEPIEDGVYVSSTTAKLMDLAQKLQSKKIALYMTTPDCQHFDTLSQVDKCEWNVDSSSGLSGVDFTKLMESIGKSVSMSQTNGNSKKDDRPKPLYNENKWTDGVGNIVENIKL